MTKPTKLSRAVRRACSCAIAVGSFGMMTSVALAQEAEVPDTAAASVEKIVVTGSRGAPRSLSDSPVPVDVITSDELTAVAFTDTNDVLKTLVPSYSLSRQPISDGASFIRPASMRGLDTDKTLVLVNSKRRHRAALVQIGGSGTQGPDVATIPTVALKGVEVLRDGAAAQYGSDAIAGVINFQLKDNDEGGTLTFDAGQYYEGDGENFVLAGNMGFSLGDKGFLSLSAEISDAARTYRGEQYCEEWFCLDPESEYYSAEYMDDPTFAAGIEDASTTDGSIAQPWGQPETEAYRLFYNAGYEITDKMKLYSYGNYSQSKANSNFYYRYPGNGTIEDIRLSDGSVWNFLEMFPGGFTPQFYGKVIDYSFLGGLEGELAGGIMYDISGRFGHDEIQYTLKNTVNPSMGPDSPTSFHPGDLINEETQFQADFSKEIDAGLYMPVLFAFGLSYMDESYELVGGDEDSYTAGDFATADPFDFCNDDGTATTEGLAVIAAGSTLDCSNEDDPVYTAVGVGSNGFPGYSPAYSGTYDRDSYAAYIDVSADITEKLFMQAAVRYEDYSDFDSETVWKLAGRYRLTDDFGIRASVGTGFRAPTPGQQGTTNVSTRLPEGLPVATGLFPAGGAVAQALGAEELKPETSTNYTLGFTYDLGSLSMTLDYYRIDLEDRMYAVSTMSVSTYMPTDTSDEDYESDLDAYNNYLALEEAGVSGANTIGGVFFFQNLFDTRTEGVDFVTSYNMESELGHTTYTLSVNYNKTEITEDATGLFNAEDAFDLENGNPEFRGVFTVKHSMDALTLVARANYYGSYENSDGSSTITKIQEFSPEVLMDLEASYAFSDSLSLSVGARNIFDNYPDKDETGDACCGEVYRSDSIVDWQGGYYYMRLTAAF